MRKTKNYENEMKKFSKKLFHDLDAPILRFVSEHTDENTKNILCTASPEDYVKYLAEMLGWLYLSSTFDITDDCFYHLYGENKITTLKKHYPPHDYRYQLAISDSKSDSGLLKLFQIPYYVKHGALIQAHTEILE
jgi:phosphoserine phosphatase